ncbi:pre-peptidase C-terminal domain-containing protein [Ensifer soli]|uniref:pre-peptidase C-terminal domain-containing protein n=1 Tax=Ciceribacter sp. sgz301302 TaxID=3342379 RepID=UPI0035B75819
MSSIPGNTSTTAVIQTGETIRNSLTFGGDTDWYRVELVSGLDYRFQLSGDGSSTGLVGPELRLYNDLGIEIERVEDGNITTIIELNFSAISSGTFYVEAAADRYSTGNYVLNWSSDDTIIRNITTGATLAAGQSIRSKMDASYDSDWFKIELKAGLTYGFTMSGDGSADTIVAPSLAIRDKVGTVLRQESAYNTETSISVTFTAVETGTYFLDATAEKYRGNYIVKSIATDTVLNNTSTKVSLKDGGSIVGKIDVEQDSDWYVLSVKKGITYQISTSAIKGVDFLDNFDAHLRDNNGNIKSSADAGQPTIEWTADFTGRAYFSIEAGYHFGYDTGRYEISVISTAPLLKGTAKNDTIRGGDTATTLYGYAGKDVLYGNGGNDKLIGGLGADKLYGGDGRDLFVFKTIRDSTVAASGRDKIFDFSVDDRDRIDLRTIDADTTARGNNKFTFIGSDMFSKEAGELRAAKVGGNTLVSGDVDGDGKSDFSIFLVGNVVLDNGSFLL